MAQEKCLYGFGCSLLAVLQLCGAFPSTPSDCQIEGIRLTCRHTMPSQIPGGISEVFITDYRKMYIANDTFNNTSWQDIRNLDIIGNTAYRFPLMNYNFFTLRNISILGIHSNTFRVIKQLAFIGMDALTTLDFSFRQHLTTNVIIPVL